jgi:hypothetical protein
MRTRELTPYINSIIKERCTYLDRLRIWFDTDRPLFTSNELQLLQTTDRVPQIDFKPMRFSSQWKQNLDLFQPTPDVLIRLKEQLRPTLVAYRITYAEMAIDFITKTQEDADGIRHLLVSAMSHHAGKRYLYQADSGHAVYFADMKHKIVPVIYSDQPSKFTQEPRAHLEFRLRNSRACKRHQLFTLDDLIDFNFLAFFEKSLTLYKKPSKAEIGKFLAMTNGSTAATRRSHELRCDQFLREHQLSYDTVTVQQLLQRIPGFKACLSSQKECKKYGEELKKALLKLK